MKICFIILASIVILLSCAQNNYSVPTDLGLQSKGTPEKTMVYQAKDGTNTVAYIHRYEWEPKVGKIYHYYIVNDLLGNVIGYNRQDGYTERYIHNENKFLGHYPIDIAVAEIVATSSPLRIVPEPKEEMELRLAQEKAEREEKESNWDWRKNVSPAIPKIEEEKTESEDKPEKNKFEEDWPDEESPKKPEKEPESEEPAEDWPDESEPWPGS